MAHFAVAPVIVATVPCSDEGVSAGGQGSPLDLKIAQVPADLIINNTLEK